MNQQKVAFKIFNFRGYSETLSDNRIINNDIIGFTETQIKPSDSTSKIIETLNLFNINFQSNENKLLNLAEGSRYDIAVLNKFDANGVSILSFKKHAFADRIFTSMHIKEFFSNVAIFTSKIFHRYYSRGLQL